MPFVNYICFYIIAKTFILTEIFRQETKMSIAPKHDYWREIILLSRAWEWQLLNPRPRGGKGRYSWDSWWGCAARFFKSWPNFRPKNVIFQICFKWCEVGLKKDFCWDCLYRFRKAFAVIASNGLCYEQLSFILWSFRSDCHFWAITVSGCILSKSKLASNNM